MHEVKIKWRVGDAVPLFSAQETHNPNYNYGMVGGVYSVLFFFGSTQNPITRQVLDYIANRPDFYHDNRICFFGISIDQNDLNQKRVPMPCPSVRYFWDSSHAISQQYGAIQSESPLEATNQQEVLYTPFTLIIDPNMRVLAVIPLQDAEAHNRAFDAAIQRLPTNPDDHAGTPITAPVLVVPRVFEPAFCKHLIKVYQDTGGVKSGFMREINGITTPVMDVNFKRRSDVYVEDESLQEAIRVRIRRALIPQITKAFQFKPTRMERYLIACYDEAEKGFFSAHRDNTTKGTAHRKFACTINLNAEDFEGGNLVFPEYGRRAYRAPTGGAVIFSCSLLHTATPVTKGLRYAFLPFFYDEEGAEIRKQNQPFTTSELLDLNKGTESGG